ncbi:hypothetical protein L1987_32578 [Smallanthus sonchifolius]|uniref:Uncharacterized protein n=1 Tax=Smallanthus sonchifolius TaxID=185202 RepID=A0ACB9HR76_9ASTR|nr:hypothetical protein L1987_32578 [Smallanthus sonchifolius]
MGSLRDGMAVKNLLNTKLSSLKKGLQLYNMTLKQICKSFLLTAVVAGGDPRLSQVQVVEVFEPFSILGIEHGATDFEIKKAYTILGL